MLNFLKKIKFQSPITIASAVDLPVKPTADPFTAPPLSKEIMNQIHQSIIKAAPPEGDGNAVFLEDMTPAQFADYQHHEQDGWNNFYKKFLPFLAKEYD